jgi:hypothetical protein
MTLQTGPFPYDLDNLLGGRARVLYAVADGATPQAIPTKLNDIFDQVSPYAAKATPSPGWLEAGAARDAASYARGLSTSGYEIQQVTGPVMDEITDVGRSITVSLAEIKPAFMKILEEGQAIEAVAAAAGYSAAQRVAFGTITDLSRFRIALVAQRKIKSGVVTEPTGSIKRGRFVAVVLHEVTISADDAGVEWDKGNLVHIPLTFTAYPAAGQAAGKEYGIWLDETAGTIT